MMTDTTIYGYIFDGFVLHPDCVTDEADIKAVDDGTAGRLYSIDDNEPDGMTCDGCGAWVFEPDYRSLAVQGVEDILTDRELVPWRMAEAIVRYLEQEHGFDAEGLRPGA